MPYAREKRFYCLNCSWAGCAEDVEWIPFNPIDDFYNIDRRENPNNIINFRDVCPNCKSDVHYDIANH